MSNKQVCGKKILGEDLITIQKMLRLLMRVYNKIKEHWIRYNL